MNNVKKNKNVTYHFFLVIQRNNLAILLLKKLTTTLFLKKFYVSVWFKLPVIIELQ